MRAYELDDGKVVATANVAAAAAFEGAYEVKRQLIAEKIRIGYGNQWSAERNNLEDEIKKEDDRIDFLLATLFMPVKPDTQKG